MNEASYRYIDNYGHDVVLTTYAMSGEDAYGDATLTETTSTIKAIRKMYRGNFERNAAGGIPTGDAVFWIKDSVSLPDDATTPASQITDDGVNYQVVQIDDQRNGVVAVLVEKKR